MINVATRALKLELWYHIMKINRRTKMNKGHENENIIMKIKRRTKMNKRHENEYMLSVFFLCISFKIKNWIYTSTVPILGIAK